MGQGTVVSRIVWLLNMSVQSVDYTTNLLAQRLVFLSFSFFTVCSSTIQSYSSEYEHFMLQYTVICSPWSYYMLLDNRINLAAKSSERSFASKDLFVKSMAIKTSLHICKRHTNSKSMWFRICKCLDTVFEFWMFTVHHLLKYTVNTWWIISNNFRCLAFRQLSWLSVAVPISALG